MTTDGINETSNTGSGQAVNVVLPEAGVKWFVFALVILTALLVWTDHQSNQAEIKSNQAIKSSEESANELRMAQYWIQQAHAVCAAKGIDLPSDPFVKAANK